MEWTTPKYDGLSHDSYTLLIKGYAKVYFAYKANLPKPNLLKKGTMAEAIKAHTSISRVSREYDRKPTSDQE